MGPCRGAMPWGRAAGLGSVLRSVGRGWWEPGSALCSDARLPLPSSLPAGEASCKWKENGKGKRIVACGSSFCVGQSAALTAPAWGRAVPPVGVCTELLATSCNERLLYERTELAGFPGSCRVISTCS